MENRPSGSRGTARREAAPHRRLAPPSFPRATKLDHLLRRWRIAQALPYVPAGARVLDVGCGDGSLFRSLGGRLGEGLGLDHSLPGTIVGLRYRLVRGRFPDDLPAVAPFDVITMLAMLDEVPPDALEDLARACARHLHPGGRLIVTVASPALGAVSRLLEQAHLAARKPGGQRWSVGLAQLPSLFGQAGLGIEAARHFECGYNNLFVFARDRTDRVIVLERISFTDLSQPTPR